MLSVDLTSGSNPSYSSTVVVSRKMLQDCLRLLSPPPSPPAQQQSRSAPASASGPPLATASASASALASDWARWEEDPKLFEHADPKAFHQIVYASLLLLNPMETAATFRSIWPILEKKQEAEFRRAVFNCYKDQQLSHPDRLPMANVSLLLTPGGPKFMRFLTDWIRFILEERTKELSNKLEPHREWDLLKSPWPPTGERVADKGLVALLSECIQDKMEEVQQSKREIKEAKEQSETFVNAAADRLRALRKEVSGAQQLLSERREAVLGGKDPEPACLALQKKTAAYASKAASYLDTNAQSLGSFSSFLKSLSGIKLSLTAIRARELPLFLQHEWAACTQFDRLPDKAVEPLGGEAVSAAVNTIASHQKLAAERRLELQRQTQVLGRSGVRKRADDTTAPKSRKKDTRPRIRLQFIEEVEEESTDRFSLQVKKPSTARKALLMTSARPTLEEKKQTLTIALPKFQGRFDESRVGGFFPAQSHESWSLPRDPSTSTISVLSEQQQQQQHRQPNTEFSDHSKMSIFSPILSSSRMESPPARKGGSLSLWRQQSSGSSPGSAPPVWPQNDKDLETELENIEPAEFLEKTPNKVDVSRQWNPIRLSPSFYTSESESNPIQETTAAKIVSTTQPEKKKKKNRDKDPALASKWDDLMISLAQDPEGSFESMANLSVPDVELD